MPNKRKVRRALMRLIQAHDLYIGLSRAVTGYETAEVEVTVGVELGESGYRRQRVRFGDVRIEEGLHTLRNLAPVIFRGVDPGLPTDWFVRAESEGDGETLAIAKIQRGEQWVPGSGPLQFPRGMIVLAF